MRANGIRLLVYATHQMKAPALQPGVDGASGTGADEASVGSPGTGAEMSLVSSVAMSVVSL
jgi:hypothetical protein